jgi:hypothetical protein
VLNISDVTMPPYRNLVSRFRGEENLRARIDTRYLNQEGEDQDSWRGVSWLAR